MVAVQDRVRVYSERHGQEVEGVVVASRPHDYWLVQYDNGEMATKQLTDWDIIVPESAVTTLDHEEVLSEKYVAIVNGKITEFGDDELEATRFVVRALRLGETADVFVERTVKSYHRVDPE